MKVRKQDEDSSYIVSFLFRIILMSLSFEAKGENIFKKCLICLCSLEVALICTVRSVPSGHRKELHQYLLKSWFRILSSQCLTRHRYNPKCAVFFSLKLPASRVFLFAHLFPLVLFIIATFPCNRDREREREKWIFLFSSFCWNGWADLQWPQLTWKIPVGSVPEGMELCSSPI
jgi:hypothetical protein